MDAAYGVTPSRRRVAALQNFTLVEPCGIHTNPRFYKYRWRIWAMDNTDPDWAPELDDRIFRRYLFQQRTQPVLSLSFYDAIRRMQALVEQRAYFYAIIDPLKRADPVAPWQAGACRAPAYDDDPDEAFHGHK